MWREPSRGVKTTHQVIQAFDVEHDSLGPLVAAAQEELGFTAAADRLLGHFALSVARRLQKLIDLRSQEFGLTWGGGPGGTSRYC